MGTRSNIIVERSDGTFANSYCHWDGYLGGVGKTLHEHYSSQERAEALSALGAISSLAGRPLLEAPADRSHSFDAPMEEVVIAYGRDRGETDVDATIYDNLSEALADADQEYVYVWRRDVGAWLWGDPDGPRTPLQLVSVTLNGGNSPPVPLPINDRANRYLDQAQF